MGFHRPYNVLVDITDGASARLMAGNDLHWDDERIEWSKDGTWKIADSDLPMETPHIVWAMLIHRTRIVDAPKFRGCRFRGTRIIPGRRVGTLCNARRGIGIWHKTRTVPVDPARGLIGRLFEEEHRCDESALSAYERDLLKFGARLAFLTRGEHAADIFRMALQRDRT